MPAEKGAYKALKALGPARMGQIDDLLTKGVLARDVAHTIQNEWGLCKELGADWLRKMLERYRRTELRERVVRAVAGATEGVRASTLQKRISALDRLTDLVELQTGRYHKALQLEGRGQLLLKQATEEGRLLKEMLVELGRLQLETGVLQRAPKKVTGTMTDAAGAVSTFEWTQEQEDLFRSIGGEQGYASIAHS